MAKRVELASWRLKEKEIPPSFYLLGLLLKGGGYKR